MAEKTTRPSKDKLALHVAVTETKLRLGNEKYFHVDAYVVVCGSTLEERIELDRGLRATLPSGEVRHGRVSDRCFDGLRLSSQGHAGSDNLYAIELRYHNVSDIDERKASLMAKTLKRINGKMAKLADRFGSPKTYEDTLMHFANAIGATEIHVAHEHDDKLSDAARYSLSEGKFVVGRIVGDLIKKYAA